MKAAKLTMAIKLAARLPASRRLPCCQFFLPVAIYFIIKGSVSFWSIGRRSWKCYS